MELFYCCIFLIYLLVGLGPKFIVYLLLLHVSEPMCLLPINVKHLAGVAQPIPSLVESELTENWSASLDFL